MCERLISGEPLRQITKCAGMPGESTVFQWLARHDEFAERYARARALQTEHMAEEVFEIADNPSGDTQRDKLRVDVRHWHMARVRPGRWGDRQRLEHSGALTIEGLMREMRQRNAALPKGGDPDDE